MSKFSVGNRVNVMNLKHTENVLDIKRDWKEYCIRKQLVGSRGTITKVLDKEMYEIKMDRYSKTLVWSGNSLTLHRVEERSYCLSMLG